MFVCAPCVRLHVRVLGAEELLGAVDRDRLDLVDDLAPAVVAPPRIALRVLVRRHRSDRLEHARPGEVLGGDQLDLAALALELLAEQTGDLGVELGEPRPPQLLEGLLRDRHSQDRTGRASCFAVSALYGMVRRFVKPGGRVALGGRSTTIRALAALCAGGALLLGAGAAGAGPSNDDFAAAPAIGGWTGSVTGSSAGATFQTGEPRHEYGAAEQTIWYAWTAPQSGSVTFDTFGSDFRAFVSVYTGTRVDRLTLVARGLPTHVGNTVTRLTFAATQGTTYRIQIDGQIGSPSGNLVLSWNGPPPANDGFGAAQTIAGEGGSITGTNWRATSEAGEPVHGQTGDGTSVWYRWQAPRTGRFQVDTEGRNFNSVLAVYTGASVSALTLVAANESKSGLYGDFSRVTFTVAAGATYRIAVDGNGGGSLGTEGQIALNWRFLSTPANDAFASAQTLTGLSGSVAGTTVGATREAMEPDHGGVAAVGSVWYRFTPTHDGRITWRTDRDWEDRIAIYEGASLTALRPPKTPFRAGTTYYVVVDVASGREPSDFTLTWVTSPPDNDGRDSPFSLPREGTYRQATVTATKEAGEANHAGNPGGRSVWFRWSYVVPGTLTVETIGSDFDTLLAVYEDTTPVTADDDSGGGGASRLSFRPELQTEYRIAADGKNGAGGNLTLRWSFAPDRPANDDIAAAQWISLEKSYVRGRTFGATREAGEPDHAAAGGAHSVWYRWTAPADGLAVFDTYNVDDGWGLFSDTDYDSAIAVYRGGPGPLEQVAANDDHAGWWLSRTSFAVAKGEEYLIAVDGGDGKSGFFALNWNVGPPNDDFATAQLLDGPVGSVTGTTYHATWEGLDAGAVDQRVDPPPNVWFRWRAPETGTFRFEVRSSSTYTPRAWIWTGPNYETLELVTSAGSAAGNSVATSFEARAGTVYRIEVTSDSWGPFTLSWGRTTPPPRTLTSAERRLRRGSGDCGRDGLGDRHERARNERVRRASPQRAGARRLLGLVSLDGAVHRHARARPDGQRLLHRRRRLRRRPGRPAAQGHGRLRTERAPRGCHRRGRVQNRRRRRLARRSDRQHRARMAALDHVAGERRVRRQGDAVGVDRIGRPDRSRGERGARRALARRRPTPYDALVLVDCAGRRCRVVPDLPGDDRDGPCRLRGNEPRVARAGGRELGALRGRRRRPHRIPSDGGSHVRDRGRHAAHAGKRRAELADAAVAAERLVRERGPAPDRLLQHLPLPRPRRRQHRRDEGARRAEPRGPDRRGLGLVPLHVGRRLLALVHALDGRQRLRHRPRGLHGHVRLRRSHPSRRTTTRRAAG